MLVFEVTVSVFEMTVSVFEVTISSVFQVSGQQRAWPLTPFTDICTGPATPAPACTEPSSVVRPSHMRTTRITCLSSWRHTTTPVTSWSTLVSGTTCLTVLCLCHIHLLLQTSAVLFPVTYHHVTYHHVTCHHVTCHPVTYHHEFKIDSEDCLSSSEYKTETSV